MEERMIEKRRDNERESKREQWGWGKEWEVGSFSGRRPEGLDCEKQ